MKTTLTIFTVAAFFAACNSNPKTTEVTTTVPKDTAGLAEFNLNKEQQKEQQDLIQTEGVNDGTNNLSGNTPAVVPHTHKSSAPAKRSTASRSTRSKSVGSGTSSSSGGSGTGGSGTVAQAPQPAKKEGWSKAAKGAAIGGASGAVVGAVVSKKKGKGAIIGGILGAGGGYVIGRSKDKKDGRY